MLLSGVDLFSGQSFYSVKLVIGRVIVYACTMIIVHACTMLIVRACTVIMAHAYTMTILAPSSLPLTGSLVIPGRFGVSLIFVTENDTMLDVLIALLSVLNELNLFLIGEH